MDFSNLLSTQCGGFNKNNIFINQDQKGLQYQVEREMYELMNINLNFF